MKKYHHCVKFTYPLSFQTRIPKVDQHTGGKWLIHGTKHRKDNQLQSLELSLQNILDGNLNMTQRSPKVTCSGRYSDGMSRGKNIQGGVHLQNQWNRIPSGNSLILDI